MFLFSSHNGKVKLCGLTVCKIKFINKKFYFLLFNIPIFNCFRKLSKIFYQVNHNKSFDMSQIDSDIASYVYGCHCKQSNNYYNNVAYLATELYDMGGHSKCIRDLAKSLVGTYEQRLFLTKEIPKNNIKIISEIQKYLTLCDINNCFFDLRKKTIQLCNKIISFNPKVLFVYIHPNDILGAACLSILRRSNIKIIFFNHASHCPNLGMTFSDIILEGSYSTAKITNSRRHLYNTKIIGLQSYRKNETIYYSEKELDNLRSKMGINGKKFITISGGSSYKFFDSNQKSKYFEMIKYLLQTEKDLYHIIISEFTKEQIDIINTIFKSNKNEFKRIIVLPFQTNFDKYLQCADLFIDSFPISSALTQIDLMRNKVASVIKINREQPEYSFHEYQKQDYPYMFENIEDMEKAIIKLLHNEIARNDIVTKNYDYWLKTYESDVVRQKYINIIEGKLPQKS